MTSRCDHGSKLPSHICWPGRLDAAPTTGHPLSMRWPKLPHLVPHLLIVIQWSELQHSAIIVQLLPKVMLRTGHTQRLAPQCHVRAWNTETMSGPAKGYFRKFLFSSPPALADLQRDETVE